MARASYTTDPEMVPNSITSHTDDAATVEADAATALDDDNTLAAPDGYRLSDLGNARRLLASADGRIRFVASWSRWVTYDGTRWKIDHNEIEVRRLAARIGLALLGHLGTVRKDDKRAKALLAHVKRSESAAGIAATVKVAESLPGVVIDHEELDNRPWLLNVRNGTVDLQTGTILPFDKADMLMMQAAAEFDPHAPATAWRAFLERIQPDPEVRGLMQRLGGLGLVGLQLEHLLPVGVGGGANGKSTYTNVIANVLGDYAVVASRDLLLASKHDTHPTAKADLFRKRFAHLGELPAGARLDEAQVKELTGGDRITARRMREDFWQFDPSHLLWLHANHRPSIEGTDDGIWRRVLLIPFDVQISKAEQDPHLARHIIRDEAPGVIAWMVEGLADYLANGLRPPAAVTAATDAYRSESDTVAAFIGQEGLGFHPEMWMTANELMETHGKWFRSSGVEGSEMAHYQRLTANLQSRGITKAKSRTKGGWFWSGIGLPYEDDLPRQGAPGVPLKQESPYACENQPEPLEHPGAGAAQGTF